jgi:hypothetical protein
MPHADGKSPVWASTRLLVARLMCHSASVQTDRQTVVIFALQGSKTCAGYQLLRNTICVFKKMHLRLTHSLTGLFHFQD